MSPANKRIELFSVFGLSHKTAPLEVREKLAMEGDELEALYHSLLQSGSMEGLLIISTCNRVEVYSVAENICAARATIRDEFLARLGQKGDRDLFYAHSGQEAIEHLVRVTSGLDSMVLGEPQIAGQVKEAYSCAVKLGCTDALINQLLHRCFRIAKKIRSETDIQRQPVSVPYTAVILAEQIFGNLSEKKVLLIGAGQMSELAAEHLVERKIERLWIANRSPERALALAKRFSGETIPFERYHERLDEVDIVITSTSAREILLKADEVRDAMKRRKNRPMFFIDLGVPRDIDPEINEVMNAYLFDIDDLQQVVDENLEERQKAAEGAEHIIRAEVARLSDDLSVRDLSPLISRLIARQDEIRRSEIEKLYRKLPDLDEEQREAIERQTAAIIKKVLHPTLQWLKESPDEFSPGERADIIRRLFDLKEEDCKE